MVATWLKDCGLAHRMCVQQGSFAFEYGRLPKRSFDSGSEVGARRHGEWGGYSVELSLMCGTVAVVRSDGGLPWHLIHLAALIAHHPTGCPRYKCTIAIAGLRCVVAMHHRLQVHVQMPAWVRVWFDTGGVGPLLLNPGPRWASSSSRYTETAL